MKPTTSVGEPEPVDAPAPPSAAIQLDDVTKSFGSVVAVDDVSLAIQPGEIVALLGPNGAGKTTTIDMILGLSDPTRARAEAVKAANDNGWLLG